MGLYGEPKSQGLEEFPVIQALRRAHWKKHHRMRRDDEEGEDETGVGSTGTGPPSLPPEITCRSTPGRSCRPPPEFGPNKSPLVRLVALDMASL